MIQADLELDYFMNLRLDLMGSSPMHRSNFVCQMGLLKQSREGLGDKLVLTNQAVKLQLYKLYLRTLNIHKTQYQMLQFFRIGDYGSRSALKFLGEFRKSNIHMVELRPEAYYIMINALLSQDNLGFMSIKIIKIDVYDHVIMLIDHQTSHAWIINP